MLGAGVLLESQEGLHEHVTEPGFNEIEDHQVGVGVRNEVATYPLDNVFSGDRRRRRLFHP